MKKALKHYNRIRREVMEDHKNAIKRLKAALNDSSRDNETSRYCYNPLRDNLTPSKWDAFKAEKITRKEAVNYALERGTKKINKDYAKKFEYLEDIERVALPEHISINVYWRGYTAYCDARVSGGGNDNYYFDNLSGKAGGYGYDKTSACVADALYHYAPVAKILCEVKERSLCRGISDSSGSITGRDNRNVISYGAGYDSIPHLEGGVGISCHIRILELAGYKVTSFNGKDELFITATLN